MRFETDSDAALSYIEEGLRRVTLAEKPDANVPSQAVRLEGTARR
jgi:hypothetical protein